MSEAPVPSNQLLPSSARVAPAGESFNRKLLTTVGVVALALIVLLAAWYGVSVLMLAFVAILFGVFLRRLSGILGRRTGLSDGWALLVTSLALLLIVGVGGFFLAKDIGDQIEELTKTLPKSFEKLQQQAGKYEWSRQLLGQMPNSPQEIAEKTNAAGNAPKVLSGLFNALGSLVFVLFVGLFFAASPGLYTQGLIRLVPVPRRHRAREVLDRMDHVLWHWILGTLVAMLSAAVLTGLGLWLLGVKLALVLAILAGLGEIVPNIGPIFAGLPAVLLALLDGPSKALYVALLLVGIQTFQSYLIQPLVQEKAVHIAPAMMIGVQVLMGVLLGPMGLLVATPLLAVVQVAVQMLYIEDTLGDPIERSAQRSG